MSASPTTLPTSAAPSVETIRLTIDDRPVEVLPGTTIWEAARSLGIEIPALCHDPGMDPVAVCRVCAVEVEGARVLPASCIRACEPGMVVRTETERVHNARKMVVELLMADHPSPCAKQRLNGGCELERLADDFDVSAPRFPATRQWAAEDAAPQAAPASRAERHEAGAPLPNGGGRAAATPGGAAPLNPDPQHLDPRVHVPTSPVSHAAPAPSPPLHPRLPFDPSSPVIAVDHSACILCDRCIRGCDWIQVNEVIGRTGKGFEARISFDTDSPMGESTCVSCGECMARCPTGALVDRALVAPIQVEALRPVQSVCPYCGVGCGVTMHVQEDRVVRVTGRPEAPANFGRLCVKGRYGFDYSSHPQRLTTPLIRREEYYPKGPLSEDVREQGDFRRKRRGSPPVDYSKILPAFREATWDEALDLIAERLLRIKREHGPGALAGFGSAKCTNEDNYLFQKLVRAVFGTNNVDHCTRLCHASSVAALMECIGSGSVSNPVADVALAEVCLIIGSNTTENHPVASSFIKQAVRRGTTLIVMDPRRPEMARFAHHYVRFKPGTDVALLNSIMHVILREGLQDDAFIAARTENFEALRETVRHYTPEVAEKITGVPAATIETVARLFGGTRQGIIFWGMGVSQHTTGTDNARGLISLALLTGNIGRPGTGLHPLRGQNNVQGASDVGLIPMVFTGYQPVTDPEIREKFERAWGVPLDPNPGLTVVEIMKAALEGRVRGMLMMGENPFLSDPNVNKVRKALGSLEFLAVQDIFLTETAEFADVILPASTHAEKDGTYTNTDRWVQLARQATPPPGGAREDWQVLIDLAGRMGYPMSYDSPEEIFREIAALTPDYGGLSHERLRQAPLIWPCTGPEDPGSPVLFQESFPRGRGLFSPAEFAPPQELPDASYPYVLNTGRVLQHWHTGTMTRRSRALDEICPEPFVEIHPEDARELGVEEGAALRITSRRGALVAPARITRRVDRGTVFMAFHFREAAANLLTNDALDPTAKIPEFKYCAVRVEKADPPCPDPGPQERPRHDESTLVR
ncbi:MAG: formate dehydrogenase subunit alpha [Armatimonadota bacterium]